MVPHIEDVNAREPTVELGAASNVLQGGGTRHQITLRFSQQIGHPPLFGFRRLPGGAALPLHQSSIHFERLGEDETTRRLPAFGVVGRDVLELLDKKPISARRGHGRKRHRTYPQRQIRLADARSLVELRRRGLGCGRVAPTEVAPKAFRFCTRTRTVGRAGLTPGPVGSGPFGATPLTTTRSVRGWWDRQPPAPSDPA